MSHFCNFVFAEVLAQFKPAAGGRCEWAKSRAAAACSCATEGKLLQGQERPGAEVHFKLSLDFVGTFRHYINY